MPKLTVLSIAFVAGIVGIGVTSSVGSAASLDGATILIDTPPVGDGGFPSVVGPGNEWESVQDIAGLFRVTRFVDVDGDLVTVSERVERIDDGGGFSGVFVDFDFDDLNFPDMPGAEIVDVEVVDSRRAWIRTSTLLPLGFDENSLALRLHQSCTNAQYCPRLPDHKFITVRLVAAVPCVPELESVYGLAGEAPTAKLVQFDACGGATEVFDLGIAMGDAGLAYDRNRNVFYAVSGAGNIPRELWQIRLGVSSSISVVGSIPFGVADPGLAYDPDTDTLYMSDETTDQVYKLDLSNAGAPTALSNLTGLPLQNSGLAWLDGKLYGVSHDYPISNGTAKLFEINLDSQAGTDGLAENITTMIGTQFTGLAADPVMGVLYVTDTVNDQLYVIDPLAATITPVQMPNPIGTTNVEGLAMKDAPEPSFAVGLMMGVGVLVRFARRPGMRTG